MSGPVDVRKILDRRAAEAASLGRDIAALELRGVLGVFDDLIETLQYITVPTAQAMDSADRLEAIRDMARDALSAALANVGGAK